MNCYSIFDLNFLISLKENITKHKLIQNIESKERKSQRKDKSAEQKIKIERKSF